MHLTTLMYRHFGRCAGGAMDTSREGAVLSSASQHGNERTKDSPKVTGLRQCVINADLLKLLPGVEI